jgi:nitrile hydratase
MNGVHDMGGMQNFGRVPYEKDEPVFHAPWEGRLFGIVQSLRAIGKWNIDTHRHQIESIPPAEYLRLSYYEKWLRAYEELLVAHGMVTADELVSGKADPTKPKTKPVLDAAAAMRLVSRGIASSVDPAIAPRFSVGQKVRARVVNTQHHTHLPRYARGRTGVIAIDHGVYNFPDTNAYFQGTKRQHVYSVRFTARELWGEGASPRDRVHIDLWDDYLEPV